MKQRCYIVIIFLLCISCFCGCGKEHTDKDDAGFHLYYLNKDTDKLVPVKYEIKSERTEEQIEEVLAAINEVAAEINCVNALPEDVKIENYELNEQNLSIQFGIEYLNMKRSREIMCRAAFVLTLTQIEGIDYVNINIGEEPLKDSYGEPVGMMKAGDFVDSSGSSINTYQKVETVLYFGNQSGDMLIENKNEGIYSQNISMERFVLDELIKGPNEEGMIRTVPAETKIISVLTKDGICYVNFDESFLAESVDVSDEIEIYSIVNSLCELTTVNKVQFSMNGETNKMLHGSYSLAGTFSRNLDLIESKADEK